MGAEEILALRRIFSRFRSIHRNPADTLHIKLRPAVVTLDFALAPFRRKWETNRETRGDSDRAAVTYEDSVKVGAVASARITGVIDVAATPARTGLVILNGRDDVIVNRPCLLQVSSRARCFYNLMSPLPNLVVERNQAVGRKPARHIRISRLNRSTS